MLWTITHRSRNKLESELPPERGVGGGVGTVTHSTQPRDQHSVGGHPKEVRWTVTPSEGEVSKSSDSRKTFIILMF